MTLEQYLVNHPYEEDEAEVIEVIPQNEFIEEIGIGGKYDFNELLDLALNADGYVCLVEEGKNRELGYNEFDKVVTVGYEIDEEDECLIVYVKEA